MRRLVALALVVAGLAACGGESTTSEDELLAALGATELLSRELDYRVETGTDSIGVTVEVEDDYRYAAELALDGDVAYREVVFDDALAAQLLDAGAGAFLGQAGDAGTSLAPGGWVIDDLGAPATVAPQAPGDDPIVDALAYFSYVRDAARASDVRKFDKSALDYRPDEDPFDLPERGEKRFDILPTSLPSRADIERSVSAEVPELSDLRKLAVYVRDGLVVAIREAIDVEPFEDGLRRAFGVSDDDPSVLFELVNELRGTVGQDPLTARTTTLLIEAHTESLRVDLPTGTPGRLRLHVGELVTPPA